MTTAVDPKTGWQDAMPEERQEAVHFVVGEMYRDTHKNGVYRLIGSGRSLHSHQQQVILRGERETIICTMLDFHSRFQVQP